jgi:hypothetical protein
MDSYLIASGVERYFVRACSWTVVREVWRWSGGGGGGDEMVVDMVVDWDCFVDSSCFVVEYIYMCACMDKTG